MCVCVCINNLMKYELTQVVLLEHHKKPLVQNHNPSLFQIQLQMHMLFQHAIVY